MRYFVKVTQLPRKSISYFRCQDVLCVQENPDNPLETLLVVLTPKGAQLLNVLENVDSLAAEVEQGFQPDSKPTAIPPAAKPSVLAS